MAKKLNIAEFSARNTAYKQALKDTENATKQGAQKIQNEWNSINSTINKAKTSIIGLVGAWQVKSLIEDSVKLSAKAEGIRAAFDGLNQPGLLDQLKEATRNTVNDLQLMQVAVRASNFKIPLTQLATLLEFAQKRATQTGESVDYLVDSIINGIGRKSTLVLDNLGISATELQEEVKKVGDFGVATGNIVSRELEKMGDVGLTTKDRLSQINTVFENMKVKIGEVVTPYLNNLIDKFNTLSETVKNIPDWVKELATSVVTLPQKLGAGSTVLRQMPEVLKQLTVELKSGKVLAEEDAKAIKNIYDSYRAAESSLEGILRKKIGIAQWTEEERDFLKAVAEYYEMIGNGAQYGPPKPGGGGDSTDNTTTIVKQEAKQREEILLSSEMNIFEARQQMYQDYIDWYLSEEAAAADQQTKDFEEYIDAKIEEYNRYLSETEQEELARQERVQQEYLSNLSELGFALQSAFSRSGDTLLAKLGQALQIAVNIANAIERASSAESGSGGGLGVISSILGFFSLFGAQGGTFQNGRKIASFAGGGSFIVPPGYPHDSYPIRVQSGERVEITPANKVGVNDANIVKAITQLSKRIEAYNQNVATSINAMPPIKLYLDGREIAKSTQSNLNKLEREGVNKNGL